MEKIKKILNDEDTLENKYDVKKNVFDYIRVILAIFVIISHSYPLFFGSYMTDPITRIILKTESLGGFAVIGFFILSGFMITQSMMNSKNNKQFAVKRVIRIFPSLIVMLLITIFILGPIVFNGSIGEYFKSSSVWKYFVNNVNLFGNTAYAIEGVFENNPYPAAINGSLWSLKHEFIAYIVLMLLSWAKVLKNRKLTLSITIGSIFIYLFGIKFTPIFEFLGKIGIVAEIDQFVKLIMYFFIGASMYLYKDKIKMSFKYFVLAVLLFIIAILMGGTKYGLLVTMPYIIMYLGIIKCPINIFKRIGDISYGLYIYAFPIQQLIVFYLKDKINIWVYMLLSIVFTTIIAIISTLLVDKNVKKLKDKLVKNKE